MSGDISGLVVAGRSSSQRSPRWFGAWIGIRLEIVIPVGLCPGLSVGPCVWLVVSHFRIGRERCMRSRAEHRFQTPSTEARPSPPAHDQQHAAGRDQFHQRHEGRYQKAGAESCVPHPVKCLYGARVRGKEVPENPCGCRKTEQEHEDEWHRDPPGVASEPSVDGSRCDESSQSRSVDQAIHAALPGEPGLRWGCLLDGVGYGLLEGLIYWVYRVCGIGGSRRLLATAPPGFSGRSSELTRLLRPLVEDTRRGTTWKNLHPLWPGGRLAQQVDRWCNLGSQALDRGPHRFVGSDCGVVGARQAEKAPVRSGSESFQRVRQAGMSLQSLLGGAG